MTPGLRKILVVEDDHEIRYLLSIILDGEDRRIHVTATAAEAEEVLEREALDLVVLDLILPDRDGRALLRRIRERPETASVPVVVLTGRGGRELMDECVALGANAFDEKPFDADAFAAGIDAWLAHTVGWPRATFHDPVTGLLNRAGLLEVLADASAPYTLALVHVQGLTPPPGAGAPAVGEKRVRVAARAVEEVAGDRIFAARLGGGEFVLWDGDPEGRQLRGAAEAILPRLRAPDADGGGEGGGIALVTVSPGTPLEEVLAEARRRLFRSEEAKGEELGQDGEAAEITDLRILLAEDDEISAAILIHRLQKEGLPVTWCADGAEAYEEALAQVPDLVILDVKMPGMDGFEVLDRLRGTPAFSHIPIVMLTSMGSEADIVRGFQLGADDYVLKPFSPTEISARVWRLLRRGRTPTAV